MSSHKRAASDDSIDAKRVAGPHDTMLARIAEMPKKVSRSCWHNIRAVVQSHLDQCRLKASQLDACPLDDVKHEAIAADLLHVVAAVQVLEHTLNVEYEVGGGNHFHEFAKFYARRFVDDLATALWRLEDARSLIDGTPLLGSVFTTNLLRSCIQTARHSLELSPLEDGGSFGFPATLEGDDCEPRLLGFGNNCLWFTDTHIVNHAVGVWSCHNGVIGTHGVMVSRASDGSHMHVAVNPVTGSLWVYENGGFTVTSTSGAVERREYRLESTLFHLFFTSTGRLVVNYWRNGRIDDISDDGVGTAYPGVGWNDAYSRRTDARGNVWALQQSSASGQHWIDIHLTPYEMVSPEATRKFSIMLPERMRGSGPIVQDSWTCDDELVVLLRGGKSEYTVVHVSPTGESQVFDFPEPRKIADITFDQAKCQFVCYLLQKEGFTRMRAPLPRLF